MSRKKKILIFVDWFVPGYKAGGPIRSVENIVRNLEPFFDFYIFTSDRDFGDNKSYPDIEINKWVQFGENSKVFYATDEFVSLRNLKKIIQSEDFSALYLNSLFSVKFSLMPLLARKLIGVSLPAILAPRGMLGQGALRIKSLKKKLFLFFSKPLFKNITWHASSENEQKEIQKIFGRNVGIKIALNLSSKITSELKLKSKTEGELKLFFLSRISEKKNLLGALNILGKIGAGNKIYFNIYGPIEDHEYWERCKQKIKKLPENIKVEYKGVLEPKQINKNISENHFLFLPTFNENFGHVIVESFKAGCPVIISDQTPWKNLSEKKVGWELPLSNEKAFIETLVYCGKMGNEEFASFSQTSYAYAMEIMDNQDVLKQNIGLFSNI